MTITLIRHAPVVVDWDKRLRADELEQFMSEYDRAPIDTAPPSKDIFDIVNGAQWIAASTLSRSTESLAVLGVEADEISDVFAEAPLPITQWKWLRLKPMQWLTLFRVMWLLGLLKGDGSFANSKKRAQKAANRLEEIASKGVRPADDKSALWADISSEVSLSKGVRPADDKSALWADISSEVRPLLSDVVLMGHGGMNAMIAKALKRKGWKTIHKSGGVGNWSVVVYSK